jgi:ABC-2 type transport system ATP-binding protein
MSMVVWNPPGRTPLPNLTDLLAEARRLGGASALTEYWQEQPCRSAYVHGERHDLWWEFALSASFRWQAHIWRLAPEDARRRTYRLALALGLLTLLDRPVEGLTPAQRARANLAVALLPKPDLLVWEEPFCHLAGADCARAGRLVRQLNRTEGLTVVAVSGDPLGLERLDLPPVHVLKAVPGEF